MAEKRVTFKNDKGEQIVGILHDTGSEVATFKMHARSYTCSACPGLSRSFGDQQTKEMP